KYSLIMIHLNVLVSCHSSRFTQKFPHNRCVRRLPRPRRGVGASNCSFSFVFLNLQLSTLNFQPPHFSKSLPHNSLSDPHRLNPVMSILYKKGGGEVCHPERSEGSAFAPF